MRKSVFRVVSLLMVMVLLVSVTMTGCGKKEVEKVQKTSEVAANPYEKALPMTMQFYGDKSIVSPGTEEIAAKKMKDLYNIDLKIDFMDRGSYVEKLNVMIAAGTYGDVILFNDRQKMGQAVNSGLVVPLTDIVKNDDVWKKVDPAFLKSGLINGEYYFLPVVKPIPVSFNYRADWAKKLNIKTPTNPDELYAMLYAFAKKDPDGNGKDDTYGITMQGDFKNSNPIWQMYLPSYPYELGLYYDEKSDAIKSIYSLVEDMKAELTWLNKAYKEGVLDKEFLVAKNTDTESKFVTGKVGTWMFPAQYIMPRYEKIKANFPDADTTAIPVFKTKYGSIYTETDEAVSDGFFLTKKCTDKARGMKFMSYWSGPEALKDRNMGEEGKNYKVENGKITWLNENAKKVYNPGSFVTSVHDIKLDEAVPVLEKSLANIKGFEIIKGIASIKAESAVYKSKSVDLNKMGNETLLKMIMGETPIEKYDDILAQMKKIGLDEVVQDMNKVYKSKK